MRKSAIQPLSGSAGAYSLTAFAVPTSSDSLVLVSVTPPSSAAAEYLNSAGTTAFELDAPFATQTDLDRSYPSGQYTIIAIPATSFRN